MDKRRKVLVVEDDKNFRANLVELLEDEDCRVQACVSVPQARSAIEKMTFDVALVDVMLKGPADMADRGGLQVLRSLQEAGEGTRPIVLSGQRHDFDLVVDVWKKYGAVDYVFKHNIEQEGLDYLIRKLRPELNFAVPRCPNTWNALVTVLARGDDEGSFVHGVLHSLSFKGGQSLLQDRLLEATKWLVPLLPAAAGAIAANEALAGGFVRSVWSKGQGCAVEIIVHGGDVDEASLNERLSDRRKELHRRTKGGLTAIVATRPDLKRAYFSNS